MTIHYHTNEHIISPNWQQICAGCREYIVRGQKSERYRVKNVYYPHDPIVEVRHLHCRPDWVPKVKQRQPRDARGRFTSAYAGPAVGEVVEWTRLPELPNGSRVRGTGNYITYEIEADGMRGISHSQNGIDHYHVGAFFGHSEIGGRFTILSIGQ